MLSKESLLLLRENRSLVVKSDDRVVVPALAVFWRGFLIVALTASNVAQIAGDHWIGAFLNGAAISYVWWRNSHTAAHSTVPHARLLYALGAGCGTVFGMWLVRVIYAR